MDRMNTDSKRVLMPTDAVTEAVIGAAYAVQNTLWNGFLEKVYENALRIEVSRRGYEVRQQHPLEVCYRGECVGDYVADLLVSQRVLVELKTVKALDSFHYAQCMNYLKATGLPVCLLLNFANPKVDVKRIVLPSSV